MEPVLDHTARLLAIVSVNGRANAVRCMSPGCFRSVYAAIHVVEDGGELFVMGRDCFAKRYGSQGSLGEPRFGSGGRLLTNEERDLLARNTAKLLLQFEHEQNLARKSVPSPRQAPTSSAPPHPSRPEDSVSRQVPATTPWPWQKPNTSVVILAVGDGRRFVRVQHIDGSQKLAPYPVFQGWDNVLPPEVARPNYRLQTLDVLSIAPALQRLQEMGFRMSQPGRWREVRKAAGLT